VTLAACALSLLFAAVPARPGAAPPAQPLSSPLLDARTEEVGALLRCPVCQGLSVADSPSTMARNMKAEVREKLAAGYDQEQIIADFERSYGEFVRLKPKMQGVNWLVWLAPAGALLAGAAVVVWALRRSARAHPGTVAVPQGGPELPSRDALPADSRLAAAVLRVRALAYGWPDGFAPKGRS
jgi:cytochrome c-type biogenesis protein CcmH